MPQLNWLEQLAIVAAINVLTQIENQVSNPTEKAALQATITFLQSLLGGQTKKLSGL